MYIYKEAVSEGVRIVMRKAPPDCGVMRVMCLSLSFFLCVSLSHSVSHSDCVCVCMSFARMREL